MGSTRRSFTDGYKAEAVELMLDSGSSIASVANNIGVHDADGNHDRSVASHPIRQASDRQRDKSVDEQRYRHDRRLDTRGLCVLPGGFGALDETFEAITLEQLGLLDVPIALIDVVGCFDHLLAFVAACEERGSMVLEGREMLLLLAYPTGRATERSTADADIGIDIALAGSGHLHHALTTAGYEATSGCSLPG